MARINTPTHGSAAAVTTHEGAPAWPHMTAEQALRRSVCSCLLWENEFYEDGEEIATRIATLAAAVKPDKLAALAVQARSQYNLRHVPLLLLSVLARTGSGSRLVSDTIAATIQRADELAEFLAVYARVNGVAPSAVKKKLSAQVKKGLGLAFQRFDEYALGKYDRAGAVRLRDSLFLAHAKPRDDAQAALWKRLVAGKLAVPDTWETNLSQGADKKATFERLLNEGHLGYLALLRNLRNMSEAGCDEALVRAAIIARKNGAERVLPFRYVAAARAAPRFEPAIDEALLAGLAQTPKLLGKSIIIVDVSSSMYGSPVSAKSDMTRAHAACALAAIAREICEHSSIYATAGNDGNRIHATKEVPSRHGMALVDGIYDMCRPLGGGGIFLKQVMQFVHEREKKADRIIVITDEQDCDTTVGGSARNALAFGRHNYLINVASARNGVDYGAWCHIDGFSEHVLRFIGEYEGEDVAAAMPTGQPHTHH